MATARVPRRSLYEPSPPRLLFGSTTTVLSSGSEADLLCQALLKLLGGGHSPPIKGVLPAPCSTGSRPVASICRLSVQEPLSDSPDAELSISFKFSFVHSISVPRVMGKCVVHQVETRYLVRLKLPLGGHLVSQGVPLTHCHSSHRIGDFFSRFNPLDPLCFVQQGHLS